MVEFDSNGKVVHKENDLLQKIYDARVFELELKANKDLLYLVESCDRHYDVGLSKTEVLELARIFQSIGEGMV